MFLFSVERLDERIADMKREYHTLHERHSEVGTESGYIWRLFVMLNVSDRSLLKEKTLLKLVLRKTEMIYNILFSKNLSVSKSGNIEIGGKQILINCFPRDQSLGDLLYSTAKAMK